MSQRSLKGEATGLKAGSLWDLEAGSTTTKQKSTEEGKASGKTEVNRNAEAKETEITGTVEAKETEVNGKAEAKED